MTFILFFSCWKMKILCGAENVSNFGSTDIANGTSLSMSRGYDVTRHNSSSRQVDSFPRRSASLSIDRFHSAFSDLRGWPLPGGASNASFPSTIAQNASHPTTNVAPSWHLPSKTAANHTSSAYPWRSSRLQLGNSLTVEDATSSGSDSR